MNIEHIIKAWKSEHEVLDTTFPESPVGQELTHEELQEVVGGMRCTVTCEDSSLICSPTCRLNTAIVN